MKECEPESAATQAGIPTEMAAELFARLVAGDPLAPSELAATFLDPLIAHLSFKWPKVDDHLRLSAAEEALISLFKNPAKFKPELRTLLGYLQMAAEGDLKNLSQREKRHHRDRTSWDSVELDQPARNEDCEVADSELPSFDHPTLAAAIRNFTEAERRAFELMRAGERSTAAFATALGIADLAATEQASEVKRVKDRIKLRLKRAMEDGK